MHESDIYHGPPGGTLACPEQILDPRRLAKAREILSSGGVHRIDEPTWEVASQTGSGHHQVCQQGDGLEGLVCSCADYMGRNNPEIGLSAPCKHGIAVALAEGWFEKAPSQAGEYDEEVEEEIQEVTSRLQADGLLWQIGRLEEELQQVQGLAQKELDQIRLWEEGQTGKLQERIGRLSTPLESYLRHQDRKTLRLPHGELKLCALPDRIRVVDEQTFPRDRDELVRIVPEQRLPDLRKIRAHLEAKIELIQHPPKKRTPGKNGQAKAQTVPKTPAPDTIQEEGDDVLAGLDSGNSDDTGEPATPKQIGLIRKTVEEYRDLLTEKEAGHIQALLSGPLSKEKASTALDYLLGKSVKHPVTGSWEKITPGLIAERRATGKAA